MMGDPTRGFVAVLDDARCLIVSLEDGSFCERPDPGAMDHALVVAVVVTSNLLIRRGLAETLRLAAREYANMPIWLAADDPGWCSETLVEAGFAGILEGFSLPLSPAWVAGWSFPQFGTA